MQSYTIVEKESFIHEELSEDSCLPASSFASHRHRQSVGRLVVEFLHQGVASMAGVYSFFFPPLRPPLHDPGGRPVFSLPAPAKNSVPEPVGPQTYPTMAL